MVTKEMEIMVFVSADICDSEEAVKRRAAELLRVDIERCRFEPLQWRNDCGGYRGYDVYMTICTSF